ncbi:hypothetical protein ACFOED_05065 [Vulcaniibacterium thermophilum]|uniref:Uncharacterized protein n=1 Tax=Vulcaniibacterium thermophilum TaxID=1169913 RepID=A0A918YW03_9GAMM|nr:hypothetical protein GCM10007167_02760 [Vulcaniibacterium thermophilum]
MSVENNIFVRPGSLPAPADWAAAIREAGFELEIDSDFRWDEFEGFLPATYKGEPAGFELYVEDFDLSELSDDEQAALEDRTLLVTLVTHADMRQYMSSMIASAVLCSMADGQLAEGGEPPFIPAAGAIEWARKCEPGVEKLFDA